MSETENETVPAPAEAEAEEPAAEVETVAAEVETVAAEVETVAADVETVAADVETAVAEVETVAAEVETVAEAPAAEPAVAEAPAPARTVRMMTGVVISSKADKTISVRVERRVKHPVYGKFVRRSTKLAAHDENNECRDGDTVAIRQTRPVSKTKSWALHRIVERAAAAHGGAQGA